MGVGAFNVGDIEATVTARLDTSKYDRAVRKLRGGARHPIEQHVGAKVDTRSFDKADKNLSRLERSSHKVGSGFASAVPVIAKAGAAAGGAAVLGFGKAISMASDAQESASKFGIVFGKSADQAGRSLDEFAKKTGSSRYEMRQQAGDLQSLLKPMGLSEKAASGMSVKMTKLATDLGSFHNISTADALEKIRAGLVGEAEPLRAVGVQLSAARVQEEAYRSGLTKRGKEVSAAAKAQASMNLIMRDTKLAHGDAERTSKSFANQLKRLKNAGKDGLTDLGTALLPAATKGLQALNGAMPKIIAGVKKVMPAIKSAVAAVGPTLIKFGKAAIGAGRDLLDALKPAMPFIRNVVIPLVKGLAKGVGGSLIAAFKVAVPVIKIIAGVLGAIGKAAKPVSPLIEKLGMVIGFLAAGPILKGVGALGKMDGALGLVGKAARVLGKAFSWFGNTVGKVLGAVMGPIGKLAGLIGKILKFTPAGLAKSGLGKIVGKFFARGGPADGAQLAVIGEAGEEVVVPTNAAHRADGMRWLSYAAKRLGATFMATGGAAGLRSQAQGYQQREDALGKQMTRNRTLWEISGGGLSHAEHNKLVAGQRQLGTLYASERKVVERLRAAARREADDLRGQLRRAHKESERERLRGMIERRSSMASDAGARYRELGDLIGDNRVDVTSAGRDRSAAALQAAVDAADKTTADAAIADFRTRQSLAKLTAGDEDDKAAGAGLLGALTQRLNELKARLPKVSGEALAAVQGAVQGTADEIAGFADNAATAAGPSLVQQVATLNSERMTLLTSMGSNGRTVSAPIGLATMRPAAAGAAQKIINIPVTFRESPKDQHAWIRETSRNAQAFM